MHLGHYISLNFIFVYDRLSRFDKQGIQQAQQADPTIGLVYGAVQKSRNRPTSRQWHRSPFSRYRKLWTQLTICDNVLCRQYIPQPSGTVVTVPILPQSLQRQALQECHDSPAAGHQGFNKSLKLLRKKAYWTSMISDVETYCRQCQKCQQSKLSLPSRAPLTSTPIGKPWQMVAVDILSVPISVNGNKCLLVVQDYFTKWADAIPLPNQKAVTITKALVNLFAAMVYLRFYTLIRDRISRVLCLSRPLMHLEYRSHTPLPTTRKGTA